MGQVHRRSGQPCLCVTVFAQVRFLFELNNSSPNSTINNIQSHYNSHFEDANLKSHVIFQTLGYFYIFIFIIPCLIKLTHESGLG